MRLILIRHGASIHYQQDIIVGVKNCPGLTDEGFRQAEMLALRLRTLPELSDCHTLLSSPVLRAYQTAETLARTLEIPITQDHNLTEARPGVAEGLTRAAYRAQYGEFELSAEPTRPFAPGGESWFDFTGRVRAALQRLAQTYAGETVIAVTHAGFIVAAFLTIFDIPRPVAGEGKQPPMRGWLNPLHTSLTEWEVTPETWTLVRYNDVAHLVSRAAD